MTSKKTKVVCGRVPHKTAKELEETGLKVPEALEIALKTKRDPQALFKAELRSLLAEQEMLASRMAHVNLMIEDYMRKLNINKTLDELKEELFVDDNEKAVQTTLERYYYKKGNGALPLDDFIKSREGRRIIGTQLSKCDMTEEEFICALFEKHDKSIQTKLDS